MSAESRCSELQQLRDLLNGLLPDEGEADLRRHVESCGICQHELERIVNDEMDSDSVSALLRKPRMAKESALVDVMDRLRSPARSDPTQIEKPAETVSLGFLEQSDQPGSLGRLAQYEIHDVVGRGGMGIVLKGLDIKLNRVVAVKVMAPELAAHTTARKRFVREAQAAAAVSHDHVVTIHAVDEDDLPYLVMEFIDGQSLEQKIDRDGALKLTEILRIAMQVASGLSAAHKQGLIHRDIKPANILLENGVERVKITDFGLARAVDYVGITRTGEVAGTPQYMSPEQAQGERIDHRADLFSLGSMLYTMCTGRSPFRAETTMGVLRRVCDDTPRPIREVNPDIPEWLVEIVDRLLQKNPAQRYETAQEVSELFSRHLAHVQHPSVVALPDRVEKGLRNNGRAPRSRHWLMAGALLLAVIGGVGFTEATGVTHFASTVIRYVTNQGTLVVEVDDPQVGVSIDGNELVITGAGPKEFRLNPGEHTVIGQKDGRVSEQFVTITRGGRRTVRVTLEQDERPEPAGQQASDIATISEGAITEVRRFQGHTDRVTSVAISADSRYVLSSASDATLRRWDLSTGKEQYVYSMDGYARSIQFSADGSFAVTGDTVDAGVHIWDSEEMCQVRELKGHTGRVLTIKLTRDGKHVLSCSDDGTARYWDVQTGKEIFEFPIALGHDCGAAITPDGRHAIVCPRRPAHLTIHVCNLETGKVDKSIDLPTAEVAGGRVSLSPDGRYVVIPTSIGRIAKFDLHAETVRWFRQHEGACRDARFLPTGRHVVSCGGDGIIAVWSADTGGTLYRVKAHVNESIAMDVSADGRFVLSAPGWLRTPNAPSGEDLALKLWRLPESVWPKNEHAPSTADQAVVTPPRDGDTKQPDAPQQ